MHIDQLINHFQGRKSFETTDIITFYQRIEGAIKRSTLDWRIYALKDKGILHSIGRGMYSLQAGQAYRPNAQPLKKLFSQLRKEFPFLEICTWDTRWLNEFMHHQPGRFYILVEVEKEAMDSVFYYLQKKREQVFLDPTESILERYAQKNEVIIVTGLITESPIQEIDKVTTATLEKILVDVYCDPVIFATQQGKEMEVIFDTALDKYTVEEAKLLRYAARRNKRKELKTYLKKLRNGK